MHSFLIISKDKVSGQNKTSEILKENEIDIFDQSYFSFEKSAGIEEIKKIAEKLYLKPFRSEKKALILDLYLGITNEAQNALLKTLEEPPANTIVLINGENKEDFLSTIISRCKVFEIKGDELLNDDFSAHVEEILNSGEGERLEIAEKFGKDRETAIKFVSQTVLKASELSKKENPKIYLSLLKNFNEAYGILKQSNVNPRLILENTLLSL